MTKLLFGALCFSLGNMGIMAGVAHFYVKHVQGSFSVPKFLLDLVVLAAGIFGCIALIAYGLGRMVH